MTNLLADVRLALRSWRKSPGFTSIAIASIALGIGANGAIFTLVDQVLLRTLPIKKPHELVQITYSGSRYGSNWGDGSELSHPVYLEFRDNSSEVFDGVSARFGYTLHIGASGRTERATGEIVSGTYFSTLGVGAAIGRTIEPDDDRVPGGHPVAVLSHAYWKTRFGGDPNVVGSALSINGHPFTVIGIARESFDGVELGRLTQVYVPMMMKAQITPTWNALDERLYRWVKVYARLRPGVTRERAQAVLEPFYKTTLDRDLADRDFARASEENRQGYRRNRLEIADASQGRSGFRRTLTTPLWLLTATAAGVLLIACANIANLLLARGVSRQREIAVRLALGATRRRLVGQLLVESLMLSFAGGILGIGISALTAPLVLGFFTTPENPQPISTLPDWRILAFTFGTAAFTGILFGLLPALRATRPDVAPTLKEQTTTVLGGQARLRKILVASQIAVSLLLLLGAALFIRTLDNLLAVDIGFESSRLLSFNVDPSLNGYEPARTRQLVKTLLDRLRASPGVEGAGLATTRLLEGNQRTSSITVEGYRPKPDGNSSQWCNAISPGYFDAMKIPILVGRDFSERDERTDTPPPGTPAFRVAIVNESFARHYFGDGNPLGRRIGFGGDPNTPTPIEIVGVVRDSKYTDVRDRTQRQVFFPYFEQPRPGGFTVYLGTARPADSMFGVVRQTLQQIDPALPMYGARSLETQVGLSLSRERLIATMTATFGTLATLLSIVGLYGVMSFTVARRTREIGVRVALGATSGAVGWLVIREVVLITAAGIAVGLPAAWWLGRFVSSQLYGVTPRDPLSTAGAVLLLLGVAIAAGLIPSTRAARLDPVKALRTD
jgi:predicted permease